MKGKWGLVLLAASSVVQAQSFLGDLGGSTTREKMFLAVYDLPAPNLDTSAVEQIALDAMRLYARNARVQHGLPPASLPAYPEQIKTERTPGGGAQHLLSIIDDVLDLSKIEAGKLVLEESDIDIEAIVGSVVEIAGDRAHSKGLQLAADCPPIPGRLVGDATRIRQALLNYVGNAIKFTRHGSIRIRVRQQEGGNDSVVLRFEVRHRHRHCRRRHRPTVP